MNTSTDLYVIVTIISTSVATGTDILFFLIYLHGLPPACGRCDTAEKESDAGILETSPLLSPDVQSTQHVMDNDGLSPDKNDHPQHSREKIPGIHPHDGFQHSPQVLPVEDTVYS